MIDEKMVKAFADAVIRGEPWAVCAFKEGKADLDKCAKVDPKTGELYYDLDTGKSADVVSFRAQK
jgi:hypothetical protein